MTDETTGRIRIAGQILEFPKADSLTAREWHLIKQISGVRSSELGGALEAGDVDVIVAFAHIALRRAGKLRPTLDELWELNPTADLELVGLDDEDEEPDPTTAAAAGNGNGGSSETLPRNSGDPSTAISST